MNPNCFDVFSVIIDVFTDVIGLSCGQRPDTWLVEVIFVGVCMLCIECVCVFVCVRVPCKRVCIGVCVCVLVVVFIGSSAWCLSASKWSFHRGNTVCSVKPAESLVSTARCYQPRSLWYQSEELWAAQELRMGTNWHQSYSFTKYPKKEWLKVMLWGGAEFFIFDCTF